MSSVVYLLLSPVEDLSPALYADSEREAVVVRLHASGSSQSAELAQVLQSGAVTSLEPGQCLTRGQLLELLLHAPKVITL